ncbi:DUF2335 domain-containing protein [Trinickia mobilis]|uniref:DUF2335 domain-containing protein n=1 Tax=Trinickia mobilis TaxID=2816356 RepID=UPI001F5E0CEA|nr:DUF2335 domain-containing protein [Trinickia mobilis]
MAVPAENNDKGADSARSANKAPDDIVEVIEPKLDQIVERKVQIAMRMESYRGPMPSPEYMAEYDKIVPGCARMIVDEFQANSRHSRAMDLLGINGMIRRDTRAQWMAFVLVLFGFGLIWELASIGKEKSAIAVAGALLVGIATAFLTGHGPWGGSKKDEPEEDENPKPSE